MTAILPNDSELATYLQELLDKELQAAKTYLLRSVKARHFGLNKLADKYEEEAGEEQEHARRLALRLCEKDYPLAPVDGEWEINDPRPYPESWTEEPSPIAIQLWHWFAMDEAVELGVITRLEDVINCAEGNSSYDEDNASDYDDEDANSDEAPDQENNDAEQSGDEFVVSCDKPTILLLEEIWADEEKHVAWARQQMQLMGALGPSNYLATLI